MTAEPRTLLRRVDPERETLYATDDAVVMFPYERAENAS